MIKKRLQELQRHLRNIGDQSSAQNSQRFFKTGKGEYGEGDIFLGIRVPLLRKLVRQYRGLSILEASELLKSKFHEERLLSLLLLVAIFSKAAEGDRQVIYNLYMKSTQYINNWDLVDSSAEHIVGVYLRNREKKPLYKLARSKSLWERRISIMSTFHFIKNHEFDDALKISEILRLDNEDLIHKAVGWMLREIGKRDINTEERFLKKHYKSMPRTMLRYAIEKFEEEKRLAYLKGTQWKLCGQFIGKNLDDER
jgi:3-methyladenine DNA glycosylase AlkD